MTTELRDKNSRCANCGHRSRHPCTKRDFYVRPERIGNQRCGCETFIPGDVCLRCGVDVPEPDHGFWVPAACCEECYSKRHAVIFGLKGLINYYSPTRWPLKPYRDDPFVHDNWVTDLKRMKHGTR